MGFVLTATKAFDPKAFAKSLARSRMDQQGAWRGQLDTLSEDQRYYVQKSFLQSYAPADFDAWFGLSAMCTHLTRDPLLASLHNPDIWLYAMRNVWPSAAPSCQVLHAYWSSIALVRPSEHFNANTLGAIHAHVRKTVQMLQEAGHPWSTGLTPAVLSCPEEAALFDASQEQALEAIAAYTLQYRDLDAVQHIPGTFPVLTVVMRLIEMGCFPQRYETNPMPWPQVPGAWSDDLQLSLHAVMRHPQLCHWWRLPSNVPALPEHLVAPVLMLDVGLQLNFFSTLKDWMHNHA